MALAREGTDVVLNGRSGEKLDRAISEVEAVAEGDVVGCRADLTDPDDIERLVARTADEFGRLDHLVTNAGGPPSGPFLETTDEEWYAAFGLLVMSAVQLVRVASDPLQADGGGTIVIIASRSVKEAIERGEYDNYEDGLDRRSESIPVGELGDPATFGNVVAFLSSPASSHVNGTAVPVDGGMGNSNL